MDIRLKFRIQGQGLCVWHSLAWEKGGEEGGLLWGVYFKSDFHLLFTCWVLFMLPAVSQSGGGVGDGWGMCGSVGPGLGTISSSGCVRGTL